MVLWWSGMFQCRGALAAVSEIQQSGVMKYCSAEVLADVNRICNSLIAVKSNYRVLVGDSKNEWYKNMFAKIMNFSSYDVEFDTPSGVRRKTIFGGGALDERYKAVMAMASRGDPLDWALVNQLHVYSYRFTKEEQAKINTWTLGLNMGDAIAATPARSAHDVDADVSSSSKKRKERDLDNAIDQLFA